MRELFNLEAYLQWQKEQDAMKSKPLDKRGMKSS
jgi:hypothetical protein